MSYYEYYLPEYICLDNELYIILGHGNDEHDIKITQVDLIHNRVHYVVEGSMTHGKYVDIIRQCLGIIGAKNG